MKKQNSGDKVAGKLILIRHGQTQDNIAHILSGQAETALSPLGEVQAAYAGYLLAGEKIDYVYSSSLSRAFHTAALVLAAAGQEHVPVELRDELKETHLGVLTGLTYAEADKIRLEDRYDLRVPEGESQADVVARVMPLYESEVRPRLERGETVAFTAHAGIVSALGVGFGLRAADSPRRDIPNATPLVLEYSKGGKFKHAYKLLNPVSSRQP